MNAALPCRAGLAHVHDLPAAHCSVLAIAARTKPAPSCGHRQPVTDLLVPPPQVNVTLPLTVQEPSQVMLQAPAVQATLEPAPTVCVHDLPPQLTLHAGPQVPVQVAPLPHEKLQLLVVAEQVSKPQVWLLGQVQLPPAQTVASQPAMVSARAARLVKKRRMVCPLDGTAVAAVAAIVGRQRRPVKRTDAQPAESCHGVVQAWLPPTGAMWTLPTLNRDPSAHRQTPTQLIAVRKSPRGFGLQPPWTPDTDILRVSTS